LKENVMPRLHRILVPGTSYHVIARGTGRRMVFLDDRDRRDFLVRLDRIAVARHWRCLAYCLMGTHFHLVVETPSADLHHGMRDLLGTYARAFNWRYDHPGHLFRDRHRTVVIESDSQMVATIAYVLRNPVRAGLIGNAARWPWSNCADLLGEVRPAATILRTSLDGLAYFATTSDHARRELRQRLHVDPPRDDVYRRSTPHGRPDLSTLLRNGRAIDGITAAVAAGYSQAEIGAHLGLTRSAIHHRIQRNAIVAKAA
jgi:putative transposase